MDFNPRSPRGERHNTHGQNHHKKGFQSTLPARGATYLGEFRRIRVYISIHAPREGSDLRTLSGEKGVKNFNPRSPRGERHGQIRAGMSSINFNPRSPRGERRPSIGIIGRYCRFQSTLPARGATPPYIRIDPQAGISIHAPREGSDVEQFLRPQRLKISIHAPREGSDA